MEGMRLEASSRTTGYIGLGEPVKHRCVHGVKMYMNLRCTYVYLVYVHMTDACT